MNDYVYLEARRHRGWPWHEESAGKTPMYGEDGWCHSCGVPQREQCGDLILQRSGLRVGGAWVPNWRFDAYCVERSLADEIGTRFDVRLRDVSWPRDGNGDARQVVATVTGEAWYDDSSLASATAAKHSTIGERCSECGVWKWTPVSPQDIHGLKEDVRLLDYPVIASPEWFGSGYGARHQVLFKRELAQYLASASPRDFSVKEIPE
jgi:hypothetical protein